MEDRIGRFRVPLAGLVAAALVGTAVVASMDNGDGDPRVWQGGTESSALGTDDGPARDAPLAAMESEAEESPTPAPTASPEPVTEPGVTDHEYVRHVCVATAAFQRSFDDSTREIEPANAEEALRALVGALAGPLDGLANDLEKGNAPNDLEQWHEDAVRRLRDTAARVREAERADELSDVLILRDGPFPRPAQEVEDRLSKAAAEVPECAGMVIFPRGIPGQD